MNKNTGENKNCRVCSSFKDWTKAESRKQRQTSSSTTNTATATSNKKCRICDVVNFTKEKFNGFFGRPTTKVEQNPNSFECPPNTQELGRATWTYLHSVAAYYPDKPTRQQQKDIKTFLRVFSSFYPCKPCAKYLLKEINEHPPKVQSRTELSTWVCQLHNEVNARLGKPIFDCSKVDERWRTGPPNGFCD